MTVKELKAFLADKPDDMMVYVDDINHSPASPSVVTMLAVTGYGSTVIYSNQDHSNFYDDVTIKEIQAIVM